MLHVCGILTLLSKGFVNPGVGIIALISSFPPIKPVSGILSLGSGQTIWRQPGGQTCGLALYSQGKDGHGHLEGDMRVPMMGMGWGN